MVDNERLLVRFAADFGSGLKEAAVQDGGFESRAPSLDKESRGGRGTCRKSSKYFDSMTGCDGPASLRCLSLAVVVRAWVWLRDSVNSRDKDAVQMASASSAWGTLAWSRLPNVNVDGGCAKWY